MSDFSDVEWNNPADDLGIKEIFEEAAVLGMSQADLLASFAPNTFEEIEAGTFHNLGYSNFYFDNPEAIETIYLHLISETGGFVAGPGWPRVVMREYLEVLCHLGKYQDDEKFSHSGKLAASLLDRSRQSTANLMDSGLFGAAENSLLLLLEADITFGSYKNAAGDREPSPELLALLSRLRSHVAVSQGFALRLAEAVLISDEPGHLPALRQCGVDLERSTSSTELPAFYAAFGELSDIPFRWQAIKLDALGQSGGKGPSPVAAMISAGLRKEEQVGGLLALDEKLKILLQHCFTPAKPNGNDGDALVAAMSAGKPALVRQLLAAGADPNLLPRPPIAIEAIFAAVDIFAAVGALGKKGASQETLERHALEALVNIGRYPIAELAPFCTNALRLSAVMRWHQSRAELPAALTGKLASRAMDLLVDGDDIGADP